MGVRTQVHRAVKGHARELEHQISACWSHRHDDASALKNFRVSFVVLEDLNAKFSAYRETYSDEFLSQMRHRIKDDIESVAAQARRFFSDEEREAKHSLPCGVRGLRARVRQEFCCVVLWRSHVGDARRNGDFCLDPETLRSREVDQAVRNTFPVLLGQIFAHFTISKWGQSYKRVTGDHNESDLTEGVLLGPHNIQILTMLRLLGYDSGDTETVLASHVMQIRAGEGKSIILGACSALLALLGFRETCVCSSDYLSNWEYSLFDNLFMAFGIAERLVSSTIKKFSNDGLQTKGDIRQLVRDLITGNSIESSRFRPSDPQEAGEEILLVDEVDVFFGEDFHGKTYLPSVLFESEEATFLSFSKSGHIARRSWTGLLSLGAHSRRKSTKRSR